ncbi:MAG: hypothetical protein AB1512_02975 [Thermodesulfobacteriota bacterium]
MAVLLNGGFHSVRAKAEEDLERILQHFGLSSEGLGELSFKGVEVSIPFCGGSTEGTHPAVTILLTVELQSHLKMTSVRAEEMFKALYMLVVSTLQEYGMPVVFRNLIVTTIVLDDGRFIPACDVGFDIDYLGEPGRLVHLPPLAVENEYIILHEFAHCCMETPPSDYGLILAAEILADLVAICALKKIIPAHKRFYREMVKESVVSKYGRELWGEDTDIKYILSNPEGFLKGFSDGVSGRFR